MVPVPSAHAAVRGRDRWCDSLRSPCDSGSATGCFSYEKLTLLCTRKSRVHEGPTFLQRVEPRTYREVSVACSWSWSAEKPGSRQAHRGQRPPTRRPENVEAQRQTRDAVGGFGEVQQLLADQIIQCVFQAESPPNGAGGMAPLCPNLVTLHEGDYAAAMSWPPSAAMQQCIWGKTPIPWGLRPKERTLLLPLPRPVRVRE